MQNYKGKWDLDFDGAFVSEVEIGDMEAILETLKSIKTQCDGAREKINTAFGREVSEMLESSTIHGESTLPGVVMVVNEAALVRLDLRVMIDEMIDMKLSIDGTRGQIDGWEKVLRDCADRVASIKHNVGNEGLGD